MACLDSTLGLWVLPLALLKCSRDPPAPPSVLAAGQALPKGRLAVLLLWLLLESSAHSWGELWLKHGRCLSLSMGSVV